jgi:hypothetical protein
MLSSSFFIAHQKKIERGYILATLQKMTYEESREKTDSALTK